MTGNKFKIDQTVVIKVQGVPRIVTKVRQILTEDKDGTSAMYEYYTDANTISWFKEADLVARK